MHHHIAASYHIQSWLISLWLWTELIAVLFPNSFWFYSSLNYCESLLLSSICEQDNREFQIISAHAALFGHSCFPCPFLFSTPVDSPSHPISYSLPSQMSCYIPLKTIIIAILTWQRMYERIHMLHIHSKSVMYVTNITCLAYTWDKTENDIANKHKLWIDYNPAKQVSLY